MVKHKNTCTLQSVLKSAFLEWMLMLLIFLDAFFSYLLRKLASFSKLQTPCLMCSRMNILVNRRLPSHFDLLCSAHKSDISSLAYCSYHSNLANAHKMCDNCLFSFAAEKKYSSERNRFLANGCISNQKFQIASDSDKLKNKSDAKDSPNIPLLNNVCSCCSEPFSRRPNSHKLIKSKLGNDAYQDGKDDGWAKTPGAPFRNRCADCMSHIQYRKLKITSDSESEVPVSDDDDANIVVCGAVELKDVVPGEKLIDLALIPPEPSSSTLEKQSTCDPRKASSSIISNAGIGHGLEELKWNQFKVRASPPRQANAAPELVAKESPSKSSSEIGESACMLSTSNGEVTKTVNYQECSLKMIKTMNDNYKLSVGRGTVPSPTFSDLVKGRDSARYHEDLKQKLSQISTSFEFSWPDTTASPRVSDRSDVNGSLTKRQSEPSIESLDGSVAIDESGGETEVDRLKHQVELDKKSVSALYKELEEERSASAIAANQAMAMINRLQEEKAAMQMEALQYLRMMEEQAEYDQEALQKANDLLSEKEKEIQDLEAEIESYRKKFGENILSESFLHRCDSNLRRNKTAAETVENHMVTTPKRTRSFKFSIMNFEDEKAYILEWLKRLEEKVQDISSVATTSESITQAKEDEVCNENQNVVVNNEDLTKTISNEIFHLNKRLEALENDRDFLQHAANTVRNGEDGLQFIQEIACNLRELREVISKR